MLYQLPNGKVIRISVEQYLDLTDDDIAHLCNPANNHGTYASSLWTGSVLRKRKQETEEKIIDKSIDFTEEDEDKSHGTNIQPEEEYLDDLPDIVDESTELD